MHQPARAIAVFASKHETPANDNSVGVDERFASRFAAVRAVLGPLVWGLDPAESLFEQWGLADDPGGLNRFANIALEAAIGSVGLIKPQIAFYERHGSRGIKALERLVEEARRAGLLVIMDAKRDAVGSTNDAYAEAFLGDGAPLQSDALTVHPYLGIGAMGTFVTRANEAGSCLLVVTRSSNPEGRALQGAIEESGESVEASLLSDVGQLNRELAPGGIGPIGAVIGSTHEKPALDLFAANASYLAPGVGAQGVTPKDVAEVFAACPERVMPSVPRLLLPAGPDVSGLRDAIGVLALEFREELG